ncbi:hypothetical protein [Natronobacterium gregoryi]|uniref:Uncharacterized protein n=2 Tax=Natronobacterium gregoryi TaxID=44930 RepID=L0ALE3_NATGS|nr:hypothetical protein [Natronobacterium gregoryi]AFZ74591.1 hypothetical protein Natgr_3472 [Natronobacterium gregoryi SP2]ELY72585.1 hypothetical protein C490_03313 [Natronobacterium gregoryi SP2]PLK19781.1 hypothetical protein CYV19_12800 [Natronobacterium gregoryi SP2]SFJ30068.1 hypothetical protein SAMN05443661_1219 [Natronobacterium gregoryi]
MSDIPEVTGSRALTTTTDRKKLAEADDYSEQDRYQAASLIRQRKDALREDVEFLETHHPELLQELREIFCEP